jgi:hypothetical protein
MMKVRQPRVPPMLRVLYLQILTEEVPEACRMPSHRNRLMNRYHRSTFDFRLQLPAFAKAIGYAVRLC